jgi:acetyl esterase/lipase
MNPGLRECCYGEVDDLLAAADELAKQDYVDPQRIYLGGHSTGGTLALLAAECSSRFRAVFSFGPAENVAGYGANNLPFSITDRREVELRAPILWLDAVRTPVFVIEGEGGNILSLQAMAGASHNPMLHFHPIKRGDHFSALGRATQLAAQKIVNDNGPTCNISFSDGELDRLTSR